MGPRKSDIAARTLRQLRAHKQLVEDAIRKLEAFTDTQARIAVIIPREELRELAALAQTTEGTRPAA
jgi:hypothetical protein